MFNPSLGDGITTRAMGHVRYIIILTCSETPRLSCQSSSFGGVFFVTNSLLGIESQRKLNNLQCRAKTSSRIFTRLATSRSHEFQGRVCCLC